MSQHSYSTSDVEYMQEVEQLTLDAPNEPEAPGGLAPPVESTPPEGSPALVGTRSQPGASIVRPDLIVEDAAKQRAFLRCRPNGSARVNYHDIRHVFLLCKPVELTDRADVNEWLHIRASTWIQTYDADGDGEVSWPDFKATIDQRVASKRLHALEIIFMTFDEPGSGPIAAKISIFVLLLIFISVLAFVAETSPQLMIGGECNRCVELEPEKAGRSYSMTCSTTEVCTAAYGSDDWICGCKEPEPPGFFGIIEVSERETKAGRSGGGERGGGHERALSANAALTRARSLARVAAQTVCIIIFTIEYLVRFTTVHGVRSGLTEMDFDLDVLGEVAAQADDAEPEPSGVMRTLRWWYDTMNLIDFAAIMPFWLTLFMGAGAGGLGFLRVLRLARAFRVFKLGKYSEGMTMFANVMLASLPAMYILFFFLFLGMVLFGSAIYFCESGDWDPATGVYMRPDVTGLGTEPTPFVSIPASFWWVLVTFTTVGYGDLYPTTEAGKAVGTLTMIAGLLVLALPITIVGANFANEYKKVHERAVATVDHDQAEAALEEAEIEAEYCAEFARVLSLEAKLSSPNGAASRAHSSGAMFDAPNESVAAESRGPPRGGLARQASLSKVHVAEHGSPETKLGVMKKLKARRQASQGGFMAGGGAANARTDVSGDELVGVFGVLDRAAKQKAAEHCAREIVDLVEDALENERLAPDASRALIDEVDALVHMNDAVDEEPGSLVGGAAAIRERETAAAAPVQKKTLKALMKKMKTQDNMKMVVRTETAIAVANRILLRCTGEFATQGSLTPPEVAKLLRLFLFLSAMVV